MASTEKRLFHAIVLMGAALTGSASLAGCGGSAGNPQPDASADGDYGRIYPDTGTLDGNYTPIMPYDPPDTGIGDGGPPVDAGDGAFGPCSLASVGHPAAAAVALMPVGPVVMGNGVCTGGGTNLQPVLLQSAQDFDAYEADAGVADAGPLASVDWTTQSLLVLQSTTHDALTAGVDGTALVISEGQYCQGTGSECTTSFYAVPKVTTVDVLGCALPSTPCMAP